MQMTPPPQARPRPFRRSVDDRVFGGVCGGLGRYWNVDPVILRVAFGVSLLFGGFGLFAYVALWLLVPDMSAPPDARISDSWGLRILGAITAFIAAAIGLGLLFGNSSNGAALIGALVAGAVVWIAMSKRTPAPTVEEQPTGYAYGGTGGYETAVLAESWPSSPPRERSYLGLIGLCAAIAAGGIALLVSSSPTVVMASTLLALGVTLVIGAFMGRARWLLLFAAPLLLMLAMVSQVERMPSPVFSTDTWYPTSVSTSQTVTSGTVDVDFSQWRGQPDGDSVRVEMGAGDVVVHAPRNWDLTVRPDLTVGEVLVDGSPVSAARPVEVAASTKQPDGSLTVDVALTAGTLRIVTDAPAAGTPIATQKEKKA